MGLSGKGRTGNDYFMTTGGAINIFLEVQPIYTIYSAGSFSRNGKNWLGTGA
jgi:hypothetical protein